MENWEQVLNDLEAGKVRSAYKVGGLWQANTQVKSAILAAFKAGHLVEYHGQVDKHNLLPQQFSVERGIRVVPGGTSVRRGAYLAPGVIIMPPAFVNVGAYVDSGTMIDSHALVGSCAQIGKNVHLSAGVQIGGVLEPIGQNPVIIEDQVFVGAGAVIVEGVVVLQGAVIAPGVVLSKGMPVYDGVEQKLLAPGTPIPANAVVVAGSRPVSDKLPWAQQQGLHLQCAVIIKYRDEKSAASLELESILR